MPKFNWRKLFRSILPEGRLASGLPRKRRLVLEALETRLSPATAIWTGASPAGSNLWSDAANWNRVGGGPIVAGDDLVFDNTGATRLNSFNDQPAGFAVNSITISNQSGGYNLAPRVSASANAIILGRPAAGADPGATGSLIVNTSGGNTVGFNITFGGTTGNQQFDTKLANSVLTVSGQLSGPNGETMTKAGVGRVILTGDNSGLTGSINVSSGILEIRHANALGDSGPGFPQNTTHDTTVQTNARLDVNLATGATFTENLLLNGPGTANVGALNNVSGNNIWTGKIRLGSDATIGVQDTADPLGPPGSRIVYTLEVQGIISDANIQNLTKEGPGTLFLNPIDANQTVALAGNTYHGNTIVNGGLLQIGHPFAMGPGGARTIVNATILQSATLTLLFDPLTNTPGHPQIAPQHLNFANQQDITLRGAGIGTTFKLVSGGAPTAPVVLSGTTAADVTVDAGRIQAALNALSTINSIGGTATVTGTISPAGDIVFSVVYGGNLAGVGLPLVTAEKLSGAGSIGVVSNTNATTVGFQVPNQFLTLNGRGVAGVTVTPRNMNTRTGGPAPVAEFTGALNNQGGQNSWKQTVTFWTSAANMINLSSYYTFVVTIGAVANSSLTVDSVINDNGVGLAQSYSFSKVGNGRLILTAANTFSANVDVLQGTLNVRDSNALGLVSTIGKEVWWGTSLELQSDSIPDSVPQDSKLPGQSIYDLVFPVTDTIQINGPGFAGQGVLYNISGVNRLLGPLDMLTTNGTTTIGVSADPDPTNLQANTWNNLSQLTLDGVVRDTIVGVFPQTQISEVGRTTLTKSGLGELVLTNDNTYLGTSFGQGTSQTFINEGWITIHNNRALGGKFDSPNGILSPTVQPGVSVADGAMLVLKRDAAANNLTVDYNMRLTGRGIDHRSEWLNRNGALLNLQGDNLVVSDVILNPTIDITFAGTLSNQPLINMSADVRGGAGLQGGNPTIHVRTRTPGGATQSAVQTITFAGNITGGEFTLTFNGVTTGPITWTPNVGSLVINIQAALDSLGSINSGNALVSATNSVGIGVELDGDVVPRPYSQLTIRGQISEAAARTDSVHGEIVKLGSQRLIIQGNNIYTGGVDIAEGVLRIQNDNALGIGPLLRTLVQNGAALEMAPTLPLGTGAIERGLQITGNRLLLNGTGNSTFNAAALTVLSNDNAWRGPITLNTSIAVTFRGPAGFRALPDMVAATTTGAGSVRIVTTTPGSIGTPGVNAVQTLSFANFVSGDTFTLTVRDGTNQATTAPIAWSANIDTLIANIQAALNAPTLEALFAAGVSFALASLVSPVIDIAPNSRLNLLGVIDDGASAIPTPRPTDIYVSGGGELLLAGINTYRGTTFVNQGVLTLVSAQGLGGAGVPGAQQVSLVDAVPEGYTVVAGGSNYRIGDVLTVQGGVLATGGTAAELVVTTIGGGGEFGPITGVSLLRAGGYASRPANPVSVANVTRTGGAPTGSGATFSRVATEFRLTFEGATTAPITFTGTDVDAVNIQNALNGLATIGGLATPGSVTVTQKNPGTFLVLFGGSLTGVIQPSFTGAVASGAGTGAVLVIEDGATVVARGAQMQVQGAVTVSGEPLAVQGTGVDLEPTIQNILIGGVADGVTGAQELSFNGATPGTTRFTLTFRGQETDPTNPLLFTGTSIDAYNIQNALNKLSTITAGGGSVIVTPSSPGIFLILFQGPLAATNVPLIDGTVRSAINGLPDPAFAVVGRTGTFTLAFQNPITGRNSITERLRAGATAAEVETALNRLESVQEGGLGSVLGGGFVRVKQTGTSLYNVIFAGTFADIPGIISGGNGYRVGDILTVQGGTFTTPAQFVVTSIAGTDPTGPITGVSVREAGSYLTFPSQPVNVLNVTTPAATGASFYFGPVPSLTRGPGSVTDGLTVAVTMQTLGGTANATKHQWFSAGPANTVGDTQTVHPQGLQGLPVSSRITAVTTDPSDANIIYVGTAGGGAWKTINGGQSWTPLFDGISAVQTVTVTGTDGTYRLSFQGESTVELPRNATGDQVQAALNSLQSMVRAGGSVSVTADTVPGVNEQQQLDFSSLAPGVSSFTLTFNGATTASIPYTRTAADITAIKNALNAATFATIGGLTPSPGVVQVTADPTFSVFTVTFLGSLAQTPLSFVLSATVTGPGTPLVTQSRLGVFPITTHTIVFSGGTFSSATLPTDQQLDLSGAVAGTTLYTLTFKGATTSPILFSGNVTNDVTNIANALNALPAIASAGGTVSVTPNLANQPRSGTPANTVFTIRFNAPLSREHQPLIVATDVGVTPTIGFYAVTDLPLSITPITSTVTPLSGNMAAQDNMVINGAGKSAAIYVGAIAIAPTNHNILYLGTGEHSNSGDSFAGTGVYKSTDAGRTWALLANLNPNPGGPTFNPNPIAGLSVTKIVVDPGFPGFPTSPANRPVPAIQADSDLIFVATSNVNIQNPIPGAQPAVPGVYRFNPALGAGASMWHNLTANVSVNRGGTLLGNQGGGAALTPGPDDDFRMSWWPNFAIDVAAGRVNNQAWTDLAIEYGDPTPTLPAPQHGPALPFPTPIPLLYAALGNSTNNDADANVVSPLWPTGGFNTGPGLPYHTADISNAVFRTEDPFIAAATNVSWWVGDHGVFRNQENQITITFNSPTNALGSQSMRFNLEFYGTPGINASPPLVPASPFPGSPLNSVPAVFAVDPALFGQTQLGYPSGRNDALVYASPQNIVAALSTRLPPGGTITLGANFILANQIQLQFMFGGSLSFSPQPQVFVRNIIITPFGGTPPSLPDGVNSIIAVSAGGVDTRRLEFPSMANLGANIWQTPGNGNIKFVAKELPNDGYLESITLYAIVTRSDPVSPDPRIQFEGGNFPFDHHQRHEFLGILKSTQGGWGWSFVTNPAADLQGLQQQDVGDYAATIAIDPTDVNHVIVGGVGDNLLNLPGSGPWETTDGGVTWVNIGTDGSGNGPHINSHASAFDAEGNYIVGNDGGVFRFNTTGGRSWEEINSNLTIGLLAGIDVGANNVNLALANSTGNGTAIFNGSRNWQVTNGGNGNQIFYNVKNPLIVYSTSRPLNSPTTTNLPGFPADTMNVLQNTQNNHRNFNVVSPHNPFPHTFPAYFNDLLVSLDGGLTWQPQPLLQNVATFTLDSVNDQRIVAAASSGNNVGGGPGAVRESTDGGLTWTVIDGNSTLPFPGPINPSVIALAAFQGTFQGDPGFTNITDKGPDIYDPDTIYVAQTDAGPLDFFGVQTVITRLWVTKDHGVNWLLRTNGLPTGVVITDLKVDPRNRDTVYAVIGGYLPRGSTSGTARVYKSTDAGQNWAPVGTDFPDIPAWKVVLDPRNNDLYLGTDRGVFRLEGGTGRWEIFGLGLPDVQVRDLVLNQSLNTLTAGTYGRSMFQFFLDDVRPDTGGIRAVAGSNIWTGPVALVADTSFSVDGVQGLQNGLTAAQLTFTGTIRDFVPGANSTFTKIGGGDATLAASNTYGGLTHIREGQLIVDNANALGTFTFETQTVTVTPTSGTFTLSFKGASATINVGATAAAMEAALNALSTIQSVSGRVNVTQVGNVYTIAFAGSFSGVDQPELVSSDPANVPVVTTSHGAGATLVSDGAALGLESDVQADPLLLNGDGFPFEGHFTGALHNISHNNTYTGPITFLTDVTIGVESGLTLFIGTKAGLAGVGNITDGGNSFNLTKEQTGTLVLGTANTYGGTTFINQGAVAVANAGALGGTASGTVVTDGAQLILQQSRRDEVLDLDVTFQDAASQSAQFTLGLLGQNTVTFTVNPADAIGTPGAPILATGASILAELQRLLPGLTITLENDASVAGKLDLTFKVLDAAAALGLSVASTSGFAAGTADGIVISASEQRVPIVVTGEALTLSGTGITGTGALRNTLGSNTWAGDIVLAESPAYSPPTTPDGVVTVNVDRGSDTLTITGAISEMFPTGPTGPSLATGLGKLGAGKLVLGGAGTFTGTTFINNGTLSIQHAQALGNHQGREIQRITMHDPLSSTFQLRFNGQQTTPISFLAGAALVDTALESLGTIGAGGVNVTLDTFFSGVSEVQTLILRGAVAGTQFTLTFNGATTTPIDFTGVPATDATSITAALNALGTIGGLPTIPGLVTVVPDATGTIFRISFEGGLQKQPQPDLTAAVTAGAGSASIVQTVTGIGVPLKVFTVTFVGAALTGDQPAMLVIPSPGMTAVVTTVADGGTGTSVAPGATLEIDGDPTHSGASLTIPVSETVVLNGAGAGAGALHNVSGNNVWTGNVILATDSTINVDAASRLTVTGTVQDPPGSINLPAPVPASHAGLRKDGSGALFFSRDAAQLRLDLTGSGTFTLSFNAATTSPIQTAGLTASILENAVRTIVPAGATVAVHSIAAGSFGIRLGGSLLGGPAPTLTPGNLTGTVTASVATVALTAPDNTFTGNIAIDEGILNVQSANGLGFNTSTQQDVAVSGTSGSFILDFAGFPDSVNTGPITTAGLTAAKLETALNTMLANALAPGGGTGTARVTTTPSGLSYIVTFGGSLRGSDVALLAVQNLVPNTSINITKILAGGVSNTTVATGSSLQLQSATGFTEASLKPLFISGPGLDNQGALASTGGSNTWGTAPITLVGATTGLGATAGATLIVDRPILDGGNNLGLDKFGAGTVRFTGNQANVYTGLTTVHAGSLELSKGAGVDAIVGDVNVGNDAPTLQVQTLLFGGFQTGDQFTLTYAGNTTAPITFYGNAEFAAAAIQAVLNDPAILGAGNSVTVRPGGTPNSFRVSFGGALAGTNPADLLTGAPVAPATGAINSVISVPGGAPAPNAANLVLLGDEQLSDGAAVVVRADGQFNVNNRTQTAKQVSDLTVTGGTVTTGPAANGGNLAISGNLTATNATLLTPGANAGIVVGGAADIKGGTATFAGDTSGLAVTGSLTFADDLTPAVVNATGANSFLSVGGNARMTGGTIDLSGAGSEFLLSSDASATASVNSPATITGAGTFNLTRPTSATLNTPDGPGGTDLLIQAGIDVAGTAAGIVKSGAGRLELDLNAVETYGSTNILAGDVQVNGGTTIGAVTLNGAAASLSGGGNVGQVTLASGSVNPGANGGASPDFDTLTSTGDTTWNGSTNFNVDLSNGQTAPTAPIAGTDYDVLVVNGNVELGGALLGGTSNVNTRLGDRYTILRTTGAGRITGRFAQLIDGILAVINDGESAFIGGTKYTVRYTNTTVELERTLNNATVTITSSVGGPESKYGQTVTFTATVVPERGAALPPPGSGATVTFVLDRGTINQRTQPPMALDANGQATFDPQLLPNGLWTVGSRHTIDAIFNDATRTFDAPRTATQFVANVVKNTVTISIAAVPSSATAPVYGQQVVITATIAPEEPLGVPGAALPTGEIEFVVDRGTANEQTFRRQVAASAPQTATLTVPQELAALLTPGAHTIDAAYVGSPGARTGDTNYAPTPPLTPASVTINVLTDTTTTTITPVPASSSLGQEAVFQVEVTPGFAGSAGVPVGTLELFEGTIANGPIATEPNYQGGVKTFRIQDLARGVHTIIARFTSANTNYTSSQASISYTVANAVTTTTFVAPTPPLSAAFGTQVTFVVRVDDTPDIAGNTLVPSGTVTFWLDAVNTGVNLGTGTIDPATHQASITTLPNALTPGTHDVIAVYGGDPDFATSQATLSGFLVTGPSTTTLTADTPTTTVFGQAISFTATVTPATGVPAPGAAPTGEVTLLVDGVAHGQPMTLNAQGRATFTITSIPAGSTSHSITARYNGDANYAQSISNAVQAIVNKAGTTTAIAVSLPDAIYGQDAPIQATVQAVGPGAGIPTGTVTFIVDGVPQATPVAVDAAGIARLDLRDLSGGTHKISARYNGDNNFNASTSSEVDQVIRKADLTGQLTSSAATTVFGAPVTFTVTLTPVAPARGVPTGSVIFFFNGVEQPPAPLDANGAASITTAALPVAPSIIRFRYDGDQNFNPVPPTQALSHTVVKGDVGVDLDASVSPSVFGQSVSFTATVTATAPATGVPTGSIVFSIDGVAQPAIALTNGSASFSAPSLASGGRQITAAYQGDANFNPGTAPALTQTVNQASTTTALTGPTNIASGQSATFTATVTPVAPGAGAPTGTVIFNIDGVNQAPVAVGPGGVATFTTATLGSGTHVISAVYSGDTNFLTSSAPALTRTVRPGTSTDLTTSTSTAVFGQTVTLTAVVTGISGLGTPTGTVTFRIDGSDQPPISLAGGRATLFLNRLPPGSHSIVATYSGDGNFAGSSSSALTQVINKANVTATLASSGTSAAGDQVTFTVTVAPAAPATGTPTGNVTFTIDGVAQQPVALNNGVATISVNTLGTGAHSVLAAYAGDGNFNGGNSAPLTQIVNKATLAPVVAASANPTLFGQPVTFTATIGAQAPVATGTVVFNVDGVARPGVPVAAGQATLSLLELSPGVHSISATYLGDANYNSATSAPVSQTVQQASSTVSVSTQGSSVFGQAISLNAFVGPVAPAAGTPSGTVTFLVDGTSIGTVNLNGSGQASLVTSALSAMTHSITAVYNGDANFTGSTGSSSHFVAAATPTVTLISSDPASDAGQDVTFTAMVSSGTAPVSPGGSVSFVINGSVVSTVPVDASGRAVFRMPALRAGGYSVQALYTGAGNFVPANSVTQTQRVSTVTPVITTSVRSTPAGRRFNVTVRYVNSQGELAQSFNGNVSLIARGPGSLVGPVTVAASGGVAFFSGLSGRRAGLYSLRAVADGQAEATGSMTITASRLRIRGRSRQQAGERFSLTIAAIDNAGVVDRRFTGRIALRIFRGPSGGRLRGNVTVRLVRGQVVATGLTVNRAGTYIVRASIGSLTGTFTIRALGGGRRIG